ncbi:MAG TPA: hypothetical protein VGP82_06915 [Ktedonobacterales bacterium]|nr:hypothetical protein [Ktedonobacterales bacterium]
MTDSTLAHVTPAAASAVADVDRPHPPGTRIHGRRLLVARGVWAATAAVLVGLYVLLLPACLVQLETVCTRAPCALIQPNPSSAQALQAFGFSVGNYAALTIGMIILSSVVCFVVSGVIVWRKSDDWMALVVALAGVALGTELVPYLIQTGPSTWQLLALVTNTLDFAVLFLAFALFPGGRFVPSWARWLVIGWLAAGVALVFFYLLTGELLFTAFTLVWLTVLGCLVSAQVYRYRVVSSSRERAQTRWVVFGGLSAVLVVVADFAPTYLFPAVGQPGSLYLLASAPVYTLPIIVFSVCLGIAILRHRLYDIDVILRRTLIYSLVTGTLAVVYFGSVVTLQAGFRALTGQGSALAVVASTLAIVALFQPVRGQVQAAVDRHFYRRHYDAARTLAAFSAALRSEVDLAQINEQLLNTVDEAMRPAHVSLWVAKLHHTGDEASGRSESGPGKEADAQD